MSRTLKRDINGPDFRMDPASVAESGWRAEFPAELPRPLRMSVDVGFGRGEFLLEAARQDPTGAYVGVEYSFKRVLKMARRLALSEIRNVRLVEAAAERAIPDLFRPESLHCVWINFPDPWPKARHHRRRLIQPRFIRQVAARIAAGGTLQVATDHSEYAEAIDGILSAETLLENQFAPDAWRPEIPGRKATAYELEWRAEGRELRFFAYRRAC